MTDQPKQDNRGWVRRAKSIRARGLRVHMEEQGLDYNLFELLIKQDVNTANIRRAVGIKTYTTAKKYVDEYHWERQHVQSTNT